MTVIAGDLGGTKTLLQLIDVDGAARRVVKEQRFESQRYETFDRMLREFIDPSMPRARCACFGVAGPVLESTARLTNLNWLLSERELEREFGFNRVTLVNDFHATAAGVPLLIRDDVVVINDVAPDPSSPIAILGAGTGLGEAFLVPIDGSWRIISSEGGHADFGPRDEDEIQILRFLTVKYGRVSYERLLSGTGLANIFTFLRERDFAGEVRYRDLAHLGEDDLPPKIAELAEAGDPLAARTFEIFIGVYGAEAGNLALKAVARGGVYISGGIAAKHVARFSDGRFLESFLDKGRFRPLLETCPVYLIKDATVGLRGAASIALDDCAQVPRTSW